jgi:hypothetical protein
MRHTRGLGQGGYGLLPTSPAGLRTACCRRLASHHAERLDPTCHVVVANADPPLEWSEARVRRVVQQDFYLDSYVLCRARVELSPLQSMASVQ